MLPLPPVYTIDAHNSEINLRARTQLAKRDWPH